MISEKDRSVLRELAREYAQAAASEKNIERTKLWRLHSAGKAERPIVHVEVGTFAQQVIQPRLKCVGDEARNIEYSLREAMICIQEFDDDWVVPDYYPISLHTSFTPFGITIERDFADASIGHHFKSFITDLEADFDKLKPSVFSVDMEGTVAYKEMVESVFGDILPVQIVMNGCVCSLTQDIVHIMSMEDMFCAMMDTPELFTKMIGGLADDYNRFFDMLEEKKLLMPTTGFQHVCQGTKAFTDELTENPVTTGDIWGYMDSQETVGISPEMFSELCFPAYEKVARRFGLLSYGCCEPTHQLWGDLATLPNLKRVSISPWCDEELMGERLRGSRTIFHRKPSPNYLGVGDFDEEGFREHIRKTLRAAKGCTLEITQRDVYQVPSVQAVHRYVEVIKEEITNLW